MILGRGHRNVVIVAIVPLVRDIYGLYEVYIRDDDPKKPQWKCGIFSIPIHLTICSLITTTIATTIRHGDPEKKKVTFRTVKTDSHTCSIVEKCPGKTWNYYSDHPV
uniref:Uncharacterized protein n=1 Tax=Trichogramma kaykai TaxID=54128 RepID=A0ABD2WQZ4_9HYME